MNIIQEQLFFLFRNIECISNADSYAINAIYSETEINKNKSNHNVDEWKGLFIINHYVIIIMHYNYIKIHFTMKKTSVILLYLISITLDL